jgi:hypothetical protein
MSSFTGGRCLGDNAGDFTDFRSTGRCSGKVLGGLTANLRKTNVFGALLGTTVEGTSEFTADPAPSSDDDFETALNTAVR